MQRAALIASRCLEGNKCSEHHLHGWLEVGALPKPPILLPWEGQGQAGIAAQRWAAVAELSPEPPGRTGFSILQRVLGVSLV